MRISDWSSDVCSSDLFDRTIIMSNEDSSRFRRLAARRPAGVVEAHAIDEFDGRVRRFEFVELLLNFDALAFPRSEARRVGKECVSTCSSRGSPCHSKTKTER